MVAGRLFISHFGNYHFLDNQSLKCIGIVGSRLILDYTKDVLEELIQILKNYKVCVVSGGMYGVDLYVHNLCIQNNIPTILIIPFSISYYLKSSLYKDLQNNDLSKFCIVSQSEESSLIRKFTFLKRNKLIVDSSDLILIAQSGIKSGSIYSGNYSLKCKKITYCIPNNINQKKFQGNNYLISKGSHIYLGPISIINKLESIGCYQQHSEFGELSKNLKSLFDSNALQN